MDLLADLAILGAVALAWWDIRSLIRRGGKNRWKSRTAEHGRLKTWRMNRP